MKKLSGRLAIATCVGILQHHLDNDIPLHTAIRKLSVDYASSTIRAAFARFEANNA